MRDRAGTEFFNTSISHTRRMTEYLDKLICLFRKARPGAFVKFQDKEVNHRLINGLPSEILLEVQGFLNLTAEEITHKNDLLHSQ